MRPTLTTRQQTFFDYLRRSISAQGRAPSLRQAAADLGVSHAAVAQLLRALEDKGYVRREGRYSRTLHLLTAAGGDAATPIPSPGRRIPVIGRIQAGWPLYAQQEWEGSIIVDPDRFRAPQLFALRVQGDSMQGAAILDGDLVICEPRQYAANGEIVVALINNEEATVKRFFYHGDHIELRPENPAYPPVQYDLGEVLIQGKVVGVQRQLRDR